MERMDKGMLVVGAGMILAVIAYFFGPGAANMVKKSFEDVAPVTSEVAPVDSDS